MARPSTALHGMRRPTSGKHTHTALLPLPLQGALLPRPLHATGQVLLLLPNADGRFHLLPLYPCRDGPPPFGRFYDGGGREGYERGPPPRDFRGPPPRQVLPRGCLSCRLAALPARLRPAVPAEQGLTHPPVLPSPPTHSPLVVQGLWGGAASAGAACRAARRAPRHPAHDLRRVCAALPAGQAAAGRRRRQYSWRRGQGEWGGRAAAPGGGSGGGRGGDGRRRGRATRGRGRRQPRLNVRRGVCAVLPAVRLHLYCLLLSAIVAAAGRSFATWLQRGSSWALPACSPNR